MDIHWQRAAAYVVLFDAQNRLLLSQFELEGHRMSGAWTLPGGGMEWGEQAPETVRRELAEETGLTADIGPLIGTHSDWLDATQAYRGKPGHSLRLVFAASNPQGVLKQDFSDDDTTVAASWFTLGQVQSLPRVPLVDKALALLGHATA